MITVDDKVKELIESYSQATGRPASMISVSDFLLIRQEAMTEVASAITQKPAARRTKKSTAAIREAPPEAFAETREAGTGAQAVRAAGNNVSVQSAPAMHAARAFEVPAGNTYPASPRTAAAPTPQGVPSGAPGIVPFTAAAQKAPAPALQPQRAAAAVYTEPAFNPGADGEAMTDTYVNNDYPDDDGAPSLIEMMRAVPG